LLEESAAEVGVTRERLRQVIKKMESTGIELLVPPRVVLGLLTIIRSANSEEEFWEAARKAGLFQEKKVWPLDAVMAATFVGIEILFELGVAAGSAKIQPVLARFGKRFNHVFGGIFMAIGVALPLRG